ncbi:regulatory protein RecX [Neiella sp. HB171785]|uniref:Regulatory protein RecX n=1 Tax=Neiella litorisoli TaxID=2771431 RepID=A0A8J6UIU9_9GAMM|nr:regulatory protein RecX [Neiella litorisoli]MBD1389163.1 regulatory protein RecX [Neiella litorisoli]
MKAKLNKNQLCNSLPVAVQAATAILSRRDHCRKELFQKLQLRGFDTDIIAQTIQYCVEQNWLNEAEYARIYTRLRAERGYGANRIRQELQQKGLDSGLIQQALMAFEGDWFELALLQRQKRFGEFWPTEFKLQQKQQRHLFQRGFSQEQIHYACQHQ